MPPPFSGAIAPAAVSIHVMGCVLAACSLLCDDLCSRSCIHGKPAAPGGAAFLASSGGSAVEKKGKKPPKPIIDPLSEAEAGKRADYASLFSQAVGCGPALSGGGSWRCASELWLPDKDADANAKHAERAQLLLKRSGRTHIRHY